jgi:hypothetical protein
LRPSKFSSSKSIPEFLPSILRQSLPLDSNTFRLIAVFNFVYFDIHSSISLSLSLLLREQATDSDIPGILAIIEPLAAQGILVRRSASDLVALLGSTYVFVRDGNPVLLHTCCFLMNIPFRRHTYIFFDFVNLFDLRFVI